MTPPTFQPLLAPLTEAEFLAQYDERGYELIDGVPVEVPMPGFEHGVACNLIAFYLTQFVLPLNCGRVVTCDTFVRLTTKPLTILGPDVAYFSYARLPKTECPEGPAPVVPELAVEAKSPSNYWGEILNKVGRYLDAGVTAVAVLDATTQTVAVYRVGMVQEVYAIGDVLTLPDILPDFALPVARIFA